MGKSSTNGQFSMATLNNQRVKYSRMLIFKGQLGGEHKHTKPVIWLALQMSIQCMLIMGVLGIELKGAPTSQSCLKLRKKKRVYGSCFSDCQSYSQIDCNM